MLTKERYQLRGREVAGQNMTFIPFSAQMRMSGVDLDGPGGARRQIRKGAADAVKAFVAEHGGQHPDTLTLSSNALPAQAALMQGREETEAEQLSEQIRMAEDLGAEVIRVEGRNIASTLA